MNPKTSAVLAALSEPRELTAAETYDMANTQTCPICHAAATMTFTYKTADYDSARVYCTMCSAGGSVFISNV